MKVARFKLVGKSRYSQGKHISAEKKPKESAADFEKRVWRERLHYDASGEVFIPPMAIKKTLEECAKFLSIQIPGKGKATYTKHFEAGVMCLNPVYLGVNKDKVGGEELFVPSDGKSGSGSRVLKTFPYVDNWSGEAEVLILDETITEEVFTSHLKQAGQFIGLGRFRPRNRGYYGRFVPENLTFETVEA